MPFPFDPLRALEQVRRLAADPPGQLAEGFGRLVRDAPPERLEQLMRSPVRRPLLDGIFWQMPRQLDASSAGAQPMTIRWCITGGPGTGIDTYDLHVENGTARTSREPAGGDPRLTITLDGVEFLRLASGNSDPMAAYFKGRVSLSGDLMAAARVAAMFRAPRGGDGTGANGGGAPG